MTCYCTLRRPAKAEGEDKAAEEAAAEKNQQDQTEAMRAALAKLQVWSNPILCSVYGWRIGSIQNIFSWGN